MNPIDVMDRPAKRGFQTRLLIACCGGPFLDGYVMSIIGVALLGVAEQLHPSTTESGLIGAASLIGIFFGANVFGFLTDRIGREKMYALDLVALEVACALSVFVAAPWQLIVLRFVIGAAIGADYPIATSLLTEFTPSKKRRFMVGMSAVAWSAGAAFAYVVGALVVGISGGNDHWRILLATSAVLGVIVILMRRGIPESPRWLLQNGRVADAEAVVKKIYDVTVDLSSVSIDDTDEKQKVNLRSYFRGEYLRRLIMCSALYLAVVTPLYALLTFLPRDPVRLQNFGGRVDRPDGRNRHHRAHRCRVDPRTVLGGTVGTAAGRRNSVGHHGDSADRPVAVGGWPAVVHRRHVLHLRVRLRPPEHSRVDLPQ